MQTLLIHPESGTTRTAEIICHKGLLADGQTAWMLLENNQVIDIITGFEFPWLECVRRAPKGLILEFGVRGGGTIREIAAATPQQVYGFDWWKGLPHDWDDYNPKGSCLAAKPTDLPDNVTLIEGLFSDTLEGFLEAHHGPVGFVNLDCDLYASSLFVLHCLMDRFVVGSLIALSAMARFFTKAQKQALDRYLRESGQRWEYVGKQHREGEVYRCVDIPRG